MPDKDDKERAPLRLTPPPPYSADSLAKSIIETGQSIKFIRKDLLPPLVKDTKEARDKAREALQKVDGHLEDADSHEHRCIEGDRQNRQDGDIGTLKGLSEKVQGTSQLVWWLMGLAVTLAVIAGGFAISVREHSVENSVTISDIADDVDDHDETIKAMSKSQQELRETYIREMRELPQKVTLAAQRPAPTIEEYENAADDLPLTETEQNQLLRILKRAQKRTNEEMETAAFGR
jgi:hypothetical protein